jgi:serine/threonine protein phosphatase 1
MLKRLFGRARSTEPLEPSVHGRPPAVPRGIRMFVVGDLHGRLDLLLGIEELIRADLRDSGRSRDAFVVHLGDFVDRGYDSRKVIDHLLAGRGDGPTQILLAGNHDVWLREFAGGDAVHPDQAASWMRFGGDATLLSYGVKLDSWPVSSQPAGSATTFSATPGSGPTYRWSSRQKPICSGSASRS